MDVASRDGDCDVEEIDSTGSWGGDPLNIVEAIEVRDEGGPLGSIFGWVGGGCPSTKNIIDITLIVDKVGVSFKHGVFVDGEK